MAETNQLNHAWLAALANPHHDGTTQQIDDEVQAFASDNQLLNQKKATLHTARQKEDEVWLKSQRDAVVPLLEGADKRQDGFVSAARYILSAHAGLPDTEPTKQEAKTCLQVFKDFDFHTDDAYGAEADKIIQMAQNLQSHQTFLTQIGAWTFLMQAVTAAHEVRQFLSQRAQTKGEFVKGELKTARKATDKAVAELYKTIEAMMELMPSAELTTLYTQLKGIELYARQYYLKEGSTGSGSGSGSGGGGGTASPDPSQGGGNGDNPGTGGDSGGGDNGGNGPIGDAE